RRDSSSSKRDATRGKRTPSTSSTWVSESIPGSGGDRDETVAHVRSAVHTEERTGRDIDTSTSPSRSQAACDRRQGARFSAGRSVKEEREEEDAVHQKRQADFHDDADEKARPGGQPDAAGTAQIAIHRQLADYGAGE